MDMLLIRGVLFMSVFLSAGVQRPYQLAEVPEDSGSRHAAGGDP